MRIAENDPHISNYQHVIPSTEIKFVLHIIIIIIIIIIIHHR